MDHPFDVVDEASLRKRQSAKWRAYAADVLPAWVAEMDYPLAEPIVRALHDAIAAGDTGYASGWGLAEAFAPWALAEWGWAVAPSDVHLASDVVTGITEVLRVATKERDAVLIEPPVYPPFASTVRALGRRLLEAPLRPLEGGGGWEQDIDAIERAYAAGARAHLLCSPQNPTGVVPSREVLAKIAALADAYDVLVLADEIHAPLVLPGATHTPFPTVSDAARRRSIVLTSASKGWNIAGLKAAVLVACGDGPRAVLGLVSPVTARHAGHFGVLASQAAFLQGAGWLAQARTVLDRNRALLGELLAEELPQVRYVPPRASYLAWLDCRALALGSDPAAEFLLRGRVALSNGPAFGTGGEGFARLNFATSRVLLKETVSRMKRAVSSAPR